MKRKKRISLVVLNYNGKKHLKEYFDSVFQQTRIPDEIIMLDNASADGSVEYVDLNYPKVKVIRNYYNAGTAEGSNIAFRKTTGDYVIFQSNDIRLDKNCIKELYKEIERNNRIGIVTSVLLNYYLHKKTGKKIIDNAGGISDKYGFGMQNHPSKKLKDIPGTGEVFFSYGGSFIIKRSVFIKSGGFDKRYFTLNDDIDLSWRVRLLGHKIIYTKASIVYHKVSATLGPMFDRSVKRYWSERNTFRTILKNYSLTDYLSKLPVYIFLLIAEMGYFLFRGKVSLFFADFKAVLWNLWYLPETILMRRDIYRAVKDSVTPLMKNKSIKLSLFKEFRKSL